MTVDWQLRRTSIPQALTLDACLQAGLAPATSDVQ